jgi:RND family efflux transporter MFP subunit
MKKPFFKQKRWWIILAIILIAGYFLTRTNSNTSQSDYVLESVKKGDISVQVSANGAVSAPAIYDMNPRINAKVVDILVKEGDKVSADQELIKFDDADLQAAVKSASYSFNSAVYARDKLKNAPIVDDYSVNQAQQQVNVAWVQLETAKRNLANAVIKSPINGYVLAINLKKGDYASLSSMLPAVSIAEQGDLIAKLNVNELDISKVRLEQSVDLRIDALNTNVTGKITDISPLGNDLAGIVNYEVTASIPQLEGLRIKMSVDGDITTSTTSNVLVLPSSAIREKSGQSYVLTPVFDDTGKVIDAKEMNVEVGATNNSLVEIKSGLNEGDQVLLNYDLNSNSFNFGFGSTN